jgi:hypothetical protein
MLINVIDIDAFVEVAKTNSFDWQVITATGY